jgi:hypothetical protein
MSSAPLYDTIGTTFALTRRTEPRIAEQVWAALGDASTVLNVGAGTGSYEPTDRDVTPSSRRRSCVRNGPTAQRDAWPLPPSASRSRTTPSTPQWPLPRCTTGTTRSPACARCVVWPAGWWSSLARRPKELAEPVLVDTRLPARGRCLPGWSRRTAIGPAAEQRAVRSLRDDIASGRWAERKHDLLALDAVELGLRLVIA